MRMKQWIVITFAIVLLFSLLSACTTDETNETNEAEEAEETEEKAAKNEGDVITIEDKTFSGEEYSFYKLMNQIIIELQRADDLAELDSDEADERNDFWDEEMAYYDHYNANLQALIEIYAMSLLAEEKNYFVPDEKLEAYVEEFEEELSGNDNVQERIKEFGEDDFYYYLDEYMRQTKLRDRIAAELEEEVIEENPDKEDKEINFLLREKYETLYEEHLATLELDVHVH